MEKLIKANTGINTTTPINVGSQVTWYGDLPGGYHDNYSGWSNKGARYGTVTKKSIYCQVTTKRGDIYIVAIADLTNVMDLF